MANLKTFDWQMNMGASSDARHNVTKTQFGDGYAQRVSFGINNKTTDWSGTKTGDFATVIKPIMDFIDEHQGVLPFLWQNPHGKLTTYVCQDYQVSQRKGNFWQISLKFEQVFYPIKENTMKHNLTIMRGDDTSLSIKLTQGGQAVTGIDRIDLMAKAGDETVLHLSSTKGEITHSGGVVTLNFASDKTQGKSWTQADYDMQIIKGGKISTVMYGTIHLRHDITVL